MKQTEILTHATYVNGWFPAVYMSCMSQNFRLFHVSNLSNFRIFPLMYPGSVSAAVAPSTARRMTSSPGARRQSSVSQSRTLCHVARYFVMKRAIFFTMSQPCDAINHSGVARFSFHYFREDRKTLTKRCRERRRQRLARPCVSVIGRHYCHESAIIVVVCQA